jgi:hypothetical protein
MGPRQDSHERDAGSLVEPVDSSVPRVTSGPRRAGQALAMLVVYAGLILVMCPSLLSHSAVDLPDDYLEYGITDFAFVADEVRSGRFPSWNPYRLGGGSIFADLSRMGSHYPVVLLLAVLPLDLAVLLTWLLHLALGALGIDRLARALGARSLGAAAAGISYLLASLPVVALVDGTLDNLPFVALLPWTLVFLVRMADAAPRSTGTLRAAALASLCLGLIGLGAHTRFAAIAYAATGLVGLALWLLPPRGARPPPVKWFGLLALVLILGTALALPVLWPVLLEIGATRTTPVGEPEDLVGQILPLRAIAGLVYPRILYLDERWHHLGAALLLCLLTVRSDRRSWALLCSAGVLVLLGMGATGPLFFLIQPFHWLLFPVEGAVAVMALPLLATAVGLSVDRLTSTSAAERSGLASAGLVLGVGLLVLSLGWAGSRSIYPPEMELVRSFDTGSALHGLLAVAGLALAIALSRRLGPRGLAVALLAVLLADGLAYAWRVQAAVPSPEVTPSSFVASPPSLHDLVEGTTSARVLMWPLRPLRDFDGCLDARTAEGHGWGPPTVFDPTEAIPLEASLVLAGPLRRNAGARSGVAQVGGRAKVPPMPWSVFVQWLSASGPADLGTARFTDDDPLHQAGLDGAAPVAEGWKRAAVDDEVPEAWRLMARSGGPRGACPDGPLGLAREGDDAWLPTVLELLHVGWVVSPFPIAAFPGTRSIDPAGEARARFVVDDPRPAALLSPEVVVAETPAHAERLIFGGELDLRRQAVVIGPQTAPLPGGAGAAATGEVVSWEPGAWQIELPTTGGLLTVAERFHPGWRATDGAGHALPVLEANFVQLAVAVPEGTDRVSLRFVSPGVGSGLLGGGAGLLGALLLLVPWRRRSST